MGSPKQLLRVDGESLVRRAAGAALGSRCAVVFVVTGADATAVAEELDGLRVTRVHNAHWQDGIGSSIRVAVEVVAATAPPFDAALITLVDQPLLGAQLLDQLIAAGGTAPAGLVACEYAGTVGAPAFFARRYFNALRALTGDRGGKAVLAAHADAVVRIPVAAAAIDLDTRVDYEQFTREWPASRRK